MELEQKIRYAMLAFAAATAVLAGLGLGPAMHMRALDGGGVAD